MGYSMGCLTGGESDVTTLGAGIGGGTWSGAVPQVEDNGRKDGAGSELGAEVMGYIEGYIGRY